MNTEFTVTQKRALAVLTVVALGFGAYFLRGYFILVVVAAVAAYLFTPLFQRFNRRFSKGASAALTLLSAMVSVAIPVGLLIFFATVQITNMVGSVADWVAATDLSALGQRALRVVNELLARLPFADFTVTTEWLQSRMTTVAQRVGEWLLQYLQTAVGGIIGAVTAAIIFLYVFVSLLVKGDEVQVLVRRLNPLGEEVTDLYLTKIGAMVRGTVMGQFVIAFCQGIAGAASIYIAGFHDGFFIFAIVLTALSIIPLGSGIVTIPFGIGMALFGNVIGGVFVIVWHFLVVTNIDNFLRPILVPRQARLDPALMLLAVFSGIAMFGFWGLIIGPVLMIMIVTTISVYLAVYKDVPLEARADEGEEEQRQRRRRLLRRLLWGRQPAATEAPSEESTAP